ncbi:MAG TPA: hypothetical protein VE961_00030 [Pyrinomonadaceae bacterium]|nr:hypothetical protein [Pyrinomonadaceae bacterium]
MRNFRFWLPTLIGALITPLLLLFAAISTGGGHGGYGAALVLYPLPLLILVLSLFAGVARSDAFTAKAVDTISLGVIIGLAIIQFPLYGFILSYARLKITWWLTLVAGIIYLHLFGVAVWLVIAGITWALVGGS